MRIEDVEEGQARWSLPGLGLDSVFLYGFIRLALGSDDGPCDALGRLAFPEFGKIGNYFAF